jgi:nitrate reductase NapE component
MLSVIINTGWLSPCRVGVEILWMAVLSLHTSLQTNLSLTCYRIWNLRDCTKCYKRSQPSTKLPWNDVGTNNKKSMLKAQETNSVIFIVTVFWPWRCSSLVGGWWGYSLLIPSWPALSVSLPITGDSIIYMNETVTPLSSGESFLLNTQYSTQSLQFQCRPNRFAIWRKTMTVNHIPLFRSVSGEILLPFSTIYSIYLLVHLLFILFIRMCS